MGVKMHRDSAYSNVPNCPVLTSCSFVQLLGRAHYCFCAEPISKFASAVAAARPLEIATLATVVVWSLLPWQWGLRTGCRVLGIVGSSEFFFALVFGRSRWFGGRKVLRRASMFSGCWCEGYLQLFGLLSNIVGGLLKFRPGTTSPFWGLR
jgi:hypothetical protein